MADFDMQLPKAELHLHLEGSVEPDTLRELDPDAPEGELERLYEYDNFDAFLKAFAAVSKRLRTPDDYALIARRLLERLAAEGIGYAEIIVSAGVVLWKGQEFAPVFDAIAHAAREGRVEVRWILDGVRQFGAEHVMAVAKLAVERMDRGVVGFGIGGSEERGPAGWFGEAYAFAKSAGLRLTAHAGEGTSAASVWAALKLGAERIGHGISAAEDPELMRYLRDHDVPLEVCITSNLVTGVVKRIEDHPVRRLFEAGVPITLNTDDPAMFRCTLAGEFQLAKEKLGFSDSELAQIAQNAWRYAFAASSRPA